MTSNHLYFSTSYTWFRQGFADSKIGRGHLNNELYKITIFYRLGVQYYLAKYRPTRRKLLRELMREFLSGGGELPNYVVLVFDEHYSHRLLRQTLSSVGYHIPFGIPFSTKEIHAWRIL